MIFSCPSIKPVTVAFFLRPLFPIMDDTYNKCSQSSCSGNAIIYHNVFRFTLQVILSTSSFFSSFLFSVFRNSCLFILLRRLLLCPSLFLKLSFPAYPPPPALFQGDSVHLHIPVLRVFSFVRIFGFLCLTVLHVGLLVHSVWNSCCLALSSLWVAELGCWLDDGGVSTADCLHREG